ncbi:polysaccharide pyruvyl transferase family protein [Salinibacterium sp. ZJ450]|uniref:polysaccharide pyruvyl transferase family protein n=1 Tax=Salinibacterium sp. ZJ450 TaxID=2708338 RepID=UPI00141EE7B9|nr:polysaccharide pyruvyl transferase family protein [Salinibacterium sp. ZJ450]
MATQVSIIGSALSGNKGASAMLESAIATISERRPDARFTLFSMYPNEDSRLNRYESMTIVPASPKQLGVTINLLALAYRILPPLRPVIRSKSKAIRALVDSDVLLDQGGITFTDGREKFLLYNIASILPALMVGTPVFKCAQAVGPFRSPVNRFFAKMFLPRVHTLVTRGAITHGHAESLGLTNLVAGADYAFALELDGNEKDSVSAFVLDEFFAGRPVVGVSPSVVVRKKIDAGGRDYAGEMASFVDHLVATGHRVVLLPHSVRDSSDTHNNDLPLCLEIRDRLTSSSEDVLLIDRELSSQELRYIIGRCDLFVASRFHAMVSALAMAVPVLVVGWSHKYEEVLAMFDAQEWAFGYDRFEQDYLRERFAELESRQEEVAAQLKLRLPGVKRDAAEQADLIVGALGA